MAKSRKGAPLAIPPPSEVPKTVRWLLESVDYRSSGDKAKKEAWSARYGTLGNIRKGKDVQGRLLGIIEGENRSWQYWEGAELRPLVTYIVDGGMDPFTISVRPEVPDSVKERARRLLRDPALLWRIANAIAAQGLAGERKPALVSYSVATSRFMSEAAAETVKAPSAVGKNYMLWLMLNLIPPEDIVKADRLTPQALYHFPEDGLRNKVLVITERTGMKDSQTSVRWLISEGGLVLLIPIKDSNTGEFVTKEKKVQGPTAVLATTTKSKLDEDDETRNLSVFLDETNAQTLRILQKQAEMYDGFRPLPPEEIEVFREAQRQLGENAERRVAIPFAKYLAGKFPIEKLRARRDFPRLLLLIATITFIHQYQRTRDGEGRIVAQPVDYYYARLLIADFLERTMYSLPPRSEEILEAARNSYRPEEEDGEYPTFTRRDLAKATGWHVDLLRKWIGPLEDVHFQILQGGQGKRYEYELMETLIEKLDLPSPEEVSGFISGSDNFGHASDGASSEVASGSETGTSDTSDGGVMCTFNPTEKNPKCPHCHCTPPSEPSEVGSHLNSQITSDGASSEVHPKLSEDEVPEGGLE